MRTASYDQAVSMVGSIKDASLALLATKHGAMVVSKCLSLGSTKDRKRIVKCFKGKVMEACNHPSGYLALLTLMNVVDDTVMVQKMILSEMLPNLREVAEHVTGHKVLLQLLRPNSKSYFDAREHNALELPMIPSPDDAETFVVNFKKDPEVRRQELLKGLRAPLEEMSSNSCVELMNSTAGGIILLEVVREWESPKLIQCICRAIAENGKNAIETERLYSHSIAHKTIQRFVAIGNCASNLMNEIKDQSFTWAKSNRGSFILLELANSDPTVASQLKTLLLERFDILKNLADKQRGTELLVKRIEQS